MSTSIYFKLKDLAKSQPTHSKKIESLTVQYLNARARAIHQLDLYLPDVCDGVLGQYYANVMYSDISTTWQKSAIISQSFYKCIATLLRSSKIPKSYATSFYLANLKDLKDLIWEDLKHIKGLEVDDLEEINSLVLEDLKEIDSLMLEDLKGLILKEMKGLILEDLKELNSVMVEDMKEINSSVLEELKEMKGLKLDDLEQINSLMVQDLEEIDSYMLEDLKQINSSKINEKR